MTRTNRRRLRLTLLLGSTGALTLAVGLLMTVGVARAMATTAPLAPATQAPTALDSLRRSHAMDKDWQFSRSNTYGVEVRWRKTPDGWVDVYCLEVPLTPPHDADLLVQMHPAAAELRVAGATYPLQPLANGALGVRISQALFGLGPTPVEFLAWDAGADASDDAQAFLRKGADVRR